MLCKIFQVSPVRWILVTTSIIFTLKLNEDPVLCESTTTFDTMQYYRDSMVQCDFMHEVCEGSMWLLEDELNFISWGLLVVPLTMRIVLILNEFDWIPLISITYCRFLFRKILWLGAVCSFPSLSVSAWLVFFCRNYLLFCRVADPACFISYFYLFSPGAFHLFHQYASESFS